MIAIAAITDQQGFARLRLEWEKLWRRDPLATPFQSPAWLFAWWSVFGTLEPVLLTARANGELVGLLPLYLLREPDCCKLLPIGVGLSDYIDALLNPAAASAANQLMAVMSDMPGWDECWLPDLAPESALATARSAPSLTDRIEAASPCPILALPSDPATLGKVVPRKALRDLRQARARAESAGGVSIEAVAEDGLGGAMEDLFRLHELRWRSRGESGVCSDPEVRRFHCTAAKELSKEKMLRLYHLKIGGTAAAVYYGFVAKGRAYAYLGGFDPSQEHLSPGTQIIAHAIEQAIVEGAASFDFLRGAEGYKYAWGAVDRPKISRHWSRCQTR
ncbi:MAG: GNAT family N-acetyltransferase [Alphaproteobacteria bacterium]|nr:GNAT family N-acetyltransferase [Alphaproteobacteria bacterium]